MTIEVAKVPERAEAASATSWWPFLLATTLTVTASLFPISHRWALASLVLVLASLIGWTWSNVLRVPPAEGTVGGEHGRLWWGMVLLIVSEAGLFLTGFVALTAHTDVFGPSASPSFAHLDRPLTLVASLVLWGSGLVGALAMRRGSRGLLWLTVAMGAAFVGYQAFEYHRLLGEGFTITTGGAGAIFYFLTGLHGLHVVAGLAMLVAVLLLSRRMGARADAPMRAVMLYWHFVDAAWVAIYAVLYLKWV